MQPISGWLQNILPMRLRATLSTNFYCRQSKVDKCGEAPIELGVNVDGNRFFVNLPRKCKPRELDSQGEYTSAVENRIRDYELWCLTKGRKITADGIKEFIRNGWSVPAEDLGYALAGFYSHVDGKSISDTVKRKYRLVMENFKTMCGLADDSPLETITVTACKDFVEKMKKTYKNSTYTGMLCKFNAFLVYCVENRMMDKNPFSGIKVRKEEVNIETIDFKEYDRIRDLDLGWCERLEKVRDLFVFSCNTGLSYCDTQGLQPSDFKTNENGRIYIQKGRNKTGVLYTVVVLPDALEIAKKYGYRLPSISNQKLNTYLKELKDICEVRENLTFHKARHFYARLLLNRYHFPLEIVARCMGHASTKQSSHYAKLFSSTVFDAFERI